MIVDTSALVAVLKQEAGAEAILRAISAEGGSLPAPAMIEFVMVAGGAGKVDEATLLLAAFAEQGLTTIAFTPDHAARAVLANPVYGKGNGIGGKLNILDLMVYAVAKERGERLLFTGNDFAATDLLAHPASRIG